MGISAVLLYKGNTLWVSKQPYCTMTVHYGYLSSPSVQGQYPMGIPENLLYNGCTLWISQQLCCTKAVATGIPTALLYKSSTLWVSQQFYCKRAEHYGYHSSTTIHEEYPMGIPAALLYNDSTSSVSRQSKKISNDQELIQSAPTSCPQNQKGNN